MDDGRRKEERRKDDLLHEADFKAELVSNLIVARNMAEDKPVFSPFVQRINDLINEIQMVEVQQNKRK